MLAFLGLDVLRIGVKEDVDTEKKIENLNTQRIFFGLFLSFLTTLQGQNNLRNVHFVLVLKDIFGGPLKITSQN